MMQLAEGEPCARPGSRVTPKICKVITIRGEKWNEVDREMSLRDSSGGTKASASIASHCTAVCHHFGFQNAHNLKQDAHENEYAVERV